MGAEKFRWGVKFYLNPILRTLTSYTLLHCASPTAGGGGKSTLLYARSSAFLLSSAPDPNRLTTDVTDEAKSDSARTADDQLADLVHWTLNSAA